MLIAAGCGGLGGSSGSDDSDGSGGTSVSIEGTVSYESVLPICDPTCHLDYDNLQTLPIRNAVIQVVSGTTVLATTQSSDTGHYAVTFTGSNARLLVIAEMTDPPVAILDNTDNGSGYALQSDVIAAGTTSFDVTAKLGWDSAKNIYNTSRVSPPFVLMDTALTAHETCLAGRTLPITPLDIYWAVDNRPESGTIATGQITTSHWDGTALYILGKADIDTDEFDSHVIVHEWTHYMMETQSKLDSLGGSHQEGDILDARLSFHEGLANANSGIVLQDPLYIDTAGAKQENGFSLDLDANHTGDPHPGWFSEFSVQTIIYDLVDTGTETWDNVAVNASDLYDVLLDYFKNSDALSSIYTLIAGLKTRQSASVDVAIDTLVADRNIATIIDDYGTGETNNGGDASTLPLYRDISIGSTASSVALTGAVDGYNKATANRYYRLTGNGSTLVAKATCDIAGIAVIVYDHEIFYSRSDGQIGETTCSAGVCSFSVTFSTTANRKYVINIIDNTDLDTTHHCTVSLHVSPASTLVVAANKSRRHEKPSAPVRFRADLANSIVNVDFLSAGKDVVVQVRGIDGLQTPEVSLQQPAIARGQTLAIPVRYVGAGILVMQVRGTFDGLPMHKVVSFDVDAPVAKRAKLAAPNIGGRRLHILTNN
jgi:hypothetical protein